MPFSRLLRHALVLGYLAVLLLAFAYTILRFRIAPLWPLTQFTYGMIAPFQGYATANEGWRVEGETPDGVLHPIDLAPSFPILEGERVMREQRLFYNKAFHVPLAQAILRREGNTYQRVHLTWTQWAPSIDSFRAHADTPQQQRLILTYP